jgi:transposase
MPRSRSSLAKTESLRRRGALNPHPDAVTSELFRNSELFDPRDMTQVKYEMLRRVRTEGRAVSRAAADCGLSRPAFYDAQAKFGRDGIAGLLPNKRGPKGAHKLSADVVGFIECAKREEPSLSWSSLQERVRERFDLSVHPRSIERALQRKKKQP